MGTRSESNFFLSFFLSISATGKIFSSREQLTSPFTFSFALILVIVGREQVSSVEQTSRELLNLGLKFSYRDQSPSQVFVIEL